MTEHSSLSRRSFLKRTAAAGAGLVVGFAWPRGLAAPSARAATDDAAAELDAFIHIAPDGTVTLFAPVPEIGQGVRTALPMILADELRADWANVRVVQAPADESFGSMGVGGSDSVADYWTPLRQAGARARWKLVAAASARWQVPFGTCRAEAGFVVHTPSGRRLGFGELANEAAPINAPEEVSLLDPADFRLIGTPVPRVDLEEIVRGTAGYGIDVQIPDLRVAVVARAPVHGGRVKSFDGAAALAVPGVEQVFEIEPIVPRDYLYGAVRSGVAVIARDTWSAMRGRDALRIEWDHGDHAAESSEAIATRMREALDGPLKLLRDEGEIESVWERAGAAGGSERRIESFYEVPIIGHGCMEPMNFTADVRADGCTLIGPSQHPRLLQYLVGRVLELETGAVQVQSTLEGGGFGRRLSLDYGVEAALVSKRAGVPVKVVWTREDDLRHDYYRGPSLQRMRAVIGDDGLPNAWHHTLVNSPLLSHIVARDNEHPEVYDVDGGANVPYPFEHLRFDYGAIPIGLQLGSWRSVSHTFTVFAVESFLDEIAAASRLDPLELRLRLLGEPRRLSAELPYEERHGHPYWNTGRLARVLQTAARAAGWGTAPPPGRSRGIACCYFKDTYAAHVAEVSVTAGVPRVHRIVAVIDCGRAVNPDGIAAQVEGAAIDGMAAVFKWEITVRDGRVQQSNFDGFPLLRIGEAPAIEVHIVPSEEPPSGTGEPPYPTVAPAIVNALFAATGKRVRKLPIREGAFG